MVDGQQFHGGNAETDQVVERRRMREPGVGAAQRRGHIGVRCGESADVNLVDDGVGERIPGPGMGGTGGDGAETRPRGM